MHNLKNQNSDKKFLKQAYLLANQVDPHKTTPNPRVGCVVVYKGEIISTGVHEKYGKNHAEANAIKKLEKIGFEDWGKADIYVTLQPCKKFPGKNTPSCMDLIREKGIRRVVVDSLDIHFSPLLASPRGRGNLDLEGSRSGATTGFDFQVINQGFHERLNPFFNDHIINKKPFITLKIAQSLDGKWQAPIGKWITNEASRRQVHKMRAKYSVILTTVKTITADNARLNCRLKNFPRKFSDPDLVIIGKKKPSTKIFQNKTPLNHPLSGETFSKKSSRKIWYFDKLSDFLDSDLYKKTDSIMTECGPSMCQALLSIGVVDQVDLFIAPKIFGENLLDWKSRSGKNNKENFSGNFLDGFKTIKVEKFEGDFFWKLRKIITT